MADITMCANKECPSSELCYRFKAHPNEHGQAFSDYEFAEDGKCSYMIKFNNFRDFKFLVQES